MVIAGTKRFITKVLVVATIGGTTLGVIGPAATASAAPTAGCATSSLAGAITGSESNFVSQLNDLRGSRGLGALAVNATLAAQGRGWSSTMSSQIPPGGSSADPGWLHHARDTGAGDGVAPDQDYVGQISRTVGNWLRAGENVGVSGIRSWCSDAELAASLQGATDALHRAFVASPGHLANMVGDYNQVGVGVHVTSQELWVTVRFAKGDLPAPALSSAQIATANRYTDAVYQRFLGRAANAGELSFWAGAVARGDRGALTRALSVSDEWAGTRVAALYRTVLGREPDDAGRAGWVQAISRGMRLEQVASGIYGSPERYASAGSTTAGFVDGLYRDILGRPADAGGLAYWAGRIDRRELSRTQVADGFYGSIESRTSRVRALYTEILDRAAEPAGEAYWIGRLSGLGDVVLASSLASSEEFWQRATS